MTNENLVTKEDVRLIASEVARKALIGVIDSKDIVPKADAVMAEIAERVTHQNPLVRSKRSYAGLASVAVLAAGWLGYDLQSADITEVLVLGGAAASAGLAFWDKFSDIRAVRGEG